MLDHSKRVSYTVPGTSPTGRTAAEQQHQPIMEVNHGTADCSDPHSHWNWHESCLEPITKQQHPDCNRSEQTVLQDFVGKSAFSGFSHSKQVVRPLTSRALISWSMAVGDMLLSRVTN